MGSQQQAARAPDPMDAPRDYERRRVGLSHFFSHPDAGPVAGGASI